MPDEGFWKAFLSCQYLRSHLRHKKYRNIYLEKTLGQGRPSWNNDKESFKSSLHQDTITYCIFYVRSKFKVQLECRTAHVCKVHLFFGPRSIFSENFIKLDDFLSYSANKSTEKNSSFHIPNLISGENQRSCVVYLTLGSLRKERITAQKGLQVEYLSFTLKN